MSTGQVKWFNNAKGFGFILPDGGGADLFAHYSAIWMDGYKTLKAGQAVTFDVVQGPKGLHATNIRPATEASASETNPDDNDSDGASSSRSASSDDGYRIAASAPMR
jgi:CspA family cold shock protein